MVAEDTAEGGWQRIALLWACWLARGLLAFAHGGWLWIWSCLVLGGMVAHEVVAEAQGWNMKNGRNAGRKLP